MQLRAQREAQLQSVRTLGQILRGVGIDLVLVGDTLVLLEQHHTFHVLRDAQQCTLDLPATPNRSASLGQRSSSSVPRTRNSGSRLPRRISRGTLSVPSASAEARALVELRVRRALAARTAAEERAERDRVARLERLQEERREAAARAERERELRRERAEQMRTAGQAFLGRLQLHGVDIAVDRRELLYRGREVGVVLG